MTKEAKVGLLLGLLFIVGIAVVLRGLHQDSEEEAVSSPAVTSRGDSDTIDRAARDAVKSLAKPDSGRSSRVARRRPLLRSRSRSSMRPLNGTTSVPVSGASERSAMDTRSTTGVGSSMRDRDSGVTGSERSANDGERYSMGMPTSNRTRRGEPGASSQASSDVVEPLPSAIDRATDVAMYGQRRASGLTTRSGASTTYVPRSSRSDAASNSVPRHRIHVVRKGDSLSSISLKQYGPVAGKRLVNVDRMYAANRDILKSKDMLRIGQSLKIPSLPDFEPVASNSSMGQVVGGVALVAQRYETGKKTTHVVQEGDSLWKIAQEKLGSGGRFREIARLNANTLSDENSLKVGMKLVLPNR